MPRYVTVLSDSESEDNEGHNDDDKDRNEDDQNDQNEEDDEDDEDDGDDPRVHQLRPLVEAYEFAIRNVQICGEYLEFASAQHERLQSMSAVLFEQAMSPRWSFAFIGVLKRSRALRIRTLFGDNDKDAVSTGGSCLACGAKEQHCMEALELVGDDGGVNDNAFTNLADRIDGLDMRDLSTPASKFGPYYYGVFAGGVKCLDLATAAVLARNLVLDTCVDLRNALDQVLNDETVVEQLERDEHATNPRIEPLTDCLVVARRLVTRIRTIEDVLRGRPFPVDPNLQRTGPGAVWQRLDEHLQQRCTTHEAALQFAGARARALVRGSVVPDTPAQRPAPPPANAGVLDPPVSARTRGGAARREAPVSSRTRRRA